MRPVHIPPKVISKLHPIIAAPGHALGCRGNEVLRVLARIASDNSNCWNKWWKPVMVPQVNVRRAPAGFHLFNNWYAGVAEIYLDRLRKALERRHEKAVVVFHSVCGSHGAVVSDEVSDRIDDVSELAGDERTENSRALVHLKLRKGVLLLGCVSYR